MPHIELKVSPNIADRLDSRSLMQTLVDALCHFETVDSRAVKAYQVAISDYVMGQNATDGFLHVTVMVLSGRPLELRQRMARTLQAILKTEADNLGISASLELREMDKETYVK